ncbi:hypothetical protein SPHV1_470056 [Novosphingobium sp. KN65.2]|nr:hypothetical protein SPHV1_470056 [Novosphingobium sp. KN65.2]
MRQITSLGHVEIVSSTRHLVRARAPKWIGAIEISEIVVGLGIVRLTGDGVMVDEYRRHVRHMVGLGDRGRQTRRAVRRQCIVAIADACPRHRVALDTHDISGSGTFHEPLAQINRFLDVVARRRGETGRDPDRQGHEFARRTFNRHIVKAQRSKALQTGFE